MWCVVMRRRGEGRRFLDGLLRFLLMMSLRLIRKVDLIMRNKKLSDAVQNIEIIIMT